MGFSTWKKNVLQNAAPCYGTTHGKLVTTQACVVLQSREGDGFETLRALIPTFQLSCFPVAQGRGVEGQSLHTVTVVKNQPLLVEINWPPMLQQCSHFSEYLRPFLPRHRQTHTAKL